MSASSGRTNAATGQQPYNLITPAASYPVTLAELKAWLKITNNSEDALLTMLIAAVTDAAEQFTKRDFINKQYETFRDVFGDYGEQPLYGGYPAQKVAGGEVMPITIRKSKLQTIDGITYLKDGVTTTWNALQYYIVKKPAWSQVLPAADYEYPDNDRRLQSIRILFTAGYGATAASVPANLRMALLMHAASAYSNRGDCSDPSSSCSCASAPAGSKSVYAQYRIVDFVL